MKWMLNGWDSNTYSLFFFFHSRCHQGEGKCTLTLKKRNNCPPCRFQRCLDSGMKPELVISGRKSRHRRSTVEDDKIKNGVDFSEDKIYAPVMSDEEKINQILEYHKLLVSQTSGVNLMTVPPKFLAKIQQRVMAEANLASSDQEDILAVAQLELAFLVAKDGVVFFTEIISVDQLLMSKLKGICPALIFTSVQVTILPFKCAISKVIS